MLLRPSSIAQINWKSALDAYIEALSGLVAFFPLDDPTGSLTRVVNPAVALGRNIVINGDFATDTVWLKGVGATITGGFGVFTGVLNGVLAFAQNSILVPGKTFEITFDVDDYSGGAVRVQAGTAQGTARNSNGTFTQTITCAVVSNLSFIAVGTTTLKISNVVVRQVNLPASSSIPDTQLLVDGDMAAPTTAAYTAGNSAALSKQPGQAPNTWVQQVLKIARNGVNNPFARQTILNLGLRYRYRIYNRSDGFSTPRYSDGAAVSGTTSTNWQTFDTLSLPSQTTLDMSSITSTGSQYVEFANCLVQQIPPMSGYNGNGVAANKAVQQVNAGFYLGKAYQFDGNDFINIYSGDLNSAWDRNEFTVIIFATLTSWTDGTFRRLLRLSTPTTDDIGFYRDGTNNLFSYIVRLGGVSKTVNYATSAPAGFFMASLRVSKSNDFMKADFNGLQVGSTQTGLGTPSENLVSNLCVIGAGSTTGTQGWSGKACKAVIVNQPLSDAEILQIARYGGVA